MAAPQGVQFNGTDTYLSRDADLTGAVDGKQIAGSFWYKLAATSHSGVVWGHELFGSRGFEIQISSDAILILGHNSGNTVRLNVASSANADTDWHHVLFSFDIADTAKRHLYIDDSSDLTVNTYTDDTLDFTNTNHLLGEILAGGSPAAIKFAGALADFWLFPGVYIDLSVASNRRKFVGVGAASSVDLGADGSTPTGTAPIVFFSGATATWHTNDGTGGGFTENGALTDAATNPPDYAEAGANNNGAALHHYLQQMGAR